MYSFNKKTYLKLVFRWDAPAGVPVTAEGESAKERPAAGEPSAAATAEAAAIATV